MTIIETERLTMRRAEVDDAAFIVELLNDPGWLRFIGNKNVRTPEDARAYIARALVSMYERLGFGLYLVERKADGAPVGLCGLIKRDSLEDVDLGFAFLPQFRGEGYAREAAAAVMEHARADFGLKRLVAITTQDNEASSRLLEKLGFRFERVIRTPEADEELKLFAAEL